MKTLTRRERLEACLSDTPLDRPPVALWRHFPVDDQTADGLAAAIVHYQRTYDFDFVKVTPSSSFCLQDWGVRDEWRGDTEGVRAYTHFAIREAEDWVNLKPLDPHSGWLGGQLACLRKIIAALGPEVPIIQTIFNPLSQAKNLVGKDLLTSHIRRYPEAVLAGLRTITETTQRFIEAARQTGIAGVFYAVQHAQYSVLSEQEYLTYGCPFDLHVLEGAKDFWLNVLHLHGNDVMFHLFLDYPATVINWHDQETSPSLTEAQKVWKGAVCGGLRQWHTLALGTPQDVQKEARAALQATEGKRFILGTGCVTPIIAPHCNLMAARHSVEKKS
jgi:uroporphyrinogen decarboxylase